MIKFIFNGHLFRFVRDRIIITDKYGDKYRVFMVDEPRNPFRVELLELRNPNKDPEQLSFENELLSQ